jgi:DHA1 family multidrug resistance protein-like MFS transporter
MVWLLSLICSYYTQHKQLICDCRTFWIGLIMVFASFVLAVLALPETFGPVLLKQKAQHLRKITGDTHFTAPIERGPPLRARLITNLSRPVTFFSSEPIVIFLGLYLVLIFVINFTFLSGFEYILHDTYGLSNGLSSLNFISIAVGVLIDVALTPLYSRLADRVHRRQCRAFVVRKTVESSTSLESEPSSGDVEERTELRQVSSDTPPELSLIRAAIAAPFLPASLFWLGWTNYPSIDPASGYVATVVFGYSFAAIFISSYQYVIDSYEVYASSALASITVARYIVSSGMIVATRPMYEGIGVHWTSTLMGLLALALVPVPWMLLRYGDRVRAKSKFASEIAR